MDGRTAVVERLLTVKELADRLGVKPSWVYESACYGRIPCVKVGRYDRFVFNEVLEALRERPIKPKVR